MRAALHMLVLILSAAWPALAPAEEARSLPYRVVVHPENPARGLDRAQAARLFLKKVTRWPDDVAVQPVDQRPAAGVRGRFTESVLGRSVTAVRSYWQQLIFTGRGVPPPELDSDEAVLRYVRSHRGAVGYVTGGAGLAGVREVAVE